ncbi:MAG: DUF488 family protein, N3 subclade [Candidatus Thorarchaeota archaeon]
MIETGYFAKIKEYPETDWLLCVARKYPWFVKQGRMTHMMELAPSDELLNDLKNNKITWEEYEQRYREELENSDWAKHSISWIGLKHAQGETMRLLCWEKEPPCHRFILKDIILCGE